MMEKMHQLLPWWRLRWLNYKNATIIVCLLNLATGLFLLQWFFFGSTHQPNSVSLRYIKECEEIRRSLMPVDLIKRVREIESEAYVEAKTVQQKDTKPGAAVDLVSRLNNIRSYSDTGSIKAIEEWRKRKMERARQRGLGKNGTVI
ncbi:OLC1v1023157C1 [Oldenlandia corymbosa var. corymbosa]|uniref:OLC1v1023157C1 n=1 Tax=Oldenlandia corymbosa var. corymbosa TaxID=529605 RepID=A0AAV1BZC8_OLDCO|nr:OLC1v1023157C1 [Oldenlandia corymbosa var. corymbosa]